MATPQQAVTNGASILRYSDIDPPGATPGSAGLQFVRASGLAQARLQLAVLSGNRRRALEQIDRLVTIDQQLERLSRGDAVPSEQELESELADQRLAIASEKLALTSAVELPRLEPAFGAGMGSALDPEEDIEIVEEATLGRHLRTALLWALGIIALCAAITAAALTQL